MRHIIAFLTASLNGMLTGGFGGNTQAERGGVENEPPRAELQVLINTVRWLAEGR